jgi:exosome complex component RRP4
MIDFGEHMNGFLNVAEVPRYIGRGELRDFLDFGDVVCAKVFSADSSNVELTIKLRGLGRLSGGQLINVNPNKVPRIIGKEGSMVNLIKDASECDVTVGQNGQIWLIAEKIENEINAKEIIEFICENSYLSGLTEKVEEFVEKKFGKKIKAKEYVPQPMEESRENQEGEQHNEQN